MTRGIWKGPFVHPSLLKKVDKLKDKGKDSQSKLGQGIQQLYLSLLVIVLIHNGRSFIPITISEEMVGHKLGEFSPTRKFSGHTPADKKAAAEGGAPSAAAKSAPSASSTQALKRQQQNQHQLQKEKTMQKNNLVKAINKNVRTGARKANLVLNFIKGKKADVAIKDLEFTRKKVALDIKKTVKSAIANAENNYQYDIDNLYIKEAYVGKSIIMKRFRPRAKGRAAPIKKPFSRITIILRGKTK